ncbi:rhodanese-like domain-containing protein [Priestia taiwanensis]|uniref:Rhodanese-like domain-containing protein n=1 Tax=Priestia taiwanensis TaxID=1347902 RepID=A0A917AUU5_9BACI|nr:rhodanese-like domain-containing protein [Priestia taiwanensis]MBM7363372.1 rhodanese-related sulfurtransferase [Priestia taiwanensis]GGE77705.1 rhodanese-like domain-containing protein [Priestia taiwanensis]
MIETITPQEVKERLANDETLYLIDVREDHEVQFGMIPGAVHIRMNDIPEKLDYFNEENEYIFVCRSGVRSENVCHYLQEQGLNVKNMVGGMLEWETE